MNEQNNEGTNKTIWCHNEMASPKAFLLLTATGPAIMPTSPRRSGPPLSKGRTLNSSQGTSLHQPLQQTHSLHLTQHLPIAEGAVTNPRWHRKGPAPVGGQPWPWCSSQVPAAPVSPCLTLVAHKGELLPPPAAADHEPRGWAEVPSLGLVSKAQHPLCDSGDSWQLPHARPRYHACILQQFKTFEQSSC